MAVEFRLLGHVEAYVDGSLVNLGHARQRCVLAALLLDANRPVPVAVVIDRVWANRPPQRAHNTLAGYLSRLRDVLAGATGVTFERRTDGYLVVVDPDAVDMHRFRRLVAEARRADDDEAAADLLDEALGLWHLEAFAGLDTPWITAVRASVEAERLAATLDRNDAALRLGSHAELLGELSRLAEAHASGLLKGATALGVFFDIGLCAAFIPLGIRLLRHRMQARGPMSRSPQTSTTPRIGDSR